LTGTIVTYLLWLVTCPFENAILELMQTVSSDGRDLHRAVIPEKWVGFESGPAPGVDQVDLLHSEAPGTTSSFTRDELTSDKAVGI
jgi:hypothetical protein